MSKKEMSVWIRPPSSEESLSWKAFLAMGWKFRIQTRCGSVPLFRTRDLRNMLAEMKLVEPGLDEEPEETEEIGDRESDLEYAGKIARNRSARKEDHGYTEPDMTSETAMLAALLKNEDAFPFLRGHGMPLSAKVILAMLSSTYAESHRHTSIDDIPLVFRLMGLSLEEYEAEGKSLVKYAERKDALLDIGSRDGRKYELCMNRKGYKAIHGIDFKDAPPENEEMDIPGRPRGFFKFGGRRGAPQGGERREAKPEIPKLKLDDVVLDSEAKTKLRYVVKHQMLDRRTPFRLLFWGPPGTGKTYTALALAGELGKPLITLDLSKVMDMYVGETEKILTRYFDQAEKEKAIIFMDEADSFFKERRSSNKSWENNQVNHVLKLIEARKVSVILCTNLFEALDDALLRRIDEVVEYRLPVPQDRAEIWKKELKKNGLDDDGLDLAALSRIGISGGLIANAVRKANRMKVVEGDELRVDTLFLKGLATDEMKKLGKSYAAKKICGFGG